MSVLSLNGGASAMVPLGALVKQLAHESSSREQRLHAAAQLQKLLGALDDPRLLGREPRDLLFELDELFFTRFSADIKAEIAVCIAHVGYLMSYKFKESAILFDRNWLQLRNFSFTSWVFQNVKSTSQKPDIQALYLRSLSTSLHMDRKTRRIDDTAISRTVSDVLRVLSQNDSHVVLMPLLSIICTVAPAYSRIFAPHFHDVVDIVIGWYTDPDQSNEVLAKCEQTIVALQSLWLENVEFCFKILRDLLEDAEGFAEESTKSTFASKQRPPDYCLLKIVPLLRAHATILGAVASRQGAPGDTALSDFVAVAAARLQGVATVAGGSQLNEATEAAAALVGCLAPLVDLCRPSFSPALSRAVAIAALLARSRWIQPRVLAQLLVWTRQTVLKLPSDVVAEVVAELIGPSGFVRPLRFSADASVAEAATGVYRALLTPRGINSLQQAYRNVLGELQNCLSCMRGESVRLGVENLPEFASADLGDRADVAEWVFVFLAGALMELGKAKNSLIGVCPAAAAAAAVSAAAAVQMHGLSPNLFELTARRLPLRADWFASHFAAAHFAALLTLKSHCDRHEQFLSTCEWMTEAVGARNPKITNAQTAKNFEAVVALLTELFGAAALTTETRALCLEWTTALFQSIARFASVALSNRPQIGHLAKAILHDGVALVPFEVVEECIGAACSALEQSTSFASFSSCVLETAVQLLGSWNYGGDIRGFIYNLPFSAILEHCLSTDQRDLPERFSDSVGQLTSTQFRTVADFILNNADPGCGAEDDGWQLWSQGLQLLRGECTSSTLPTSSTLSLWQWALSRAAAHCVDSRLRTAFGKPMETFLAFENELRALAGEATRGSRADSAAAAVAPSADLRAAAWFRVRSLLDFMEYLDKYMYNAYEGAAHSLEVAAKPARTFFRTNRNTCLEWLNRVRLSVIATAFHNESFALVVRWGSQALLDLQLAKRGGADATLSENVELLLVWMARALVRLESADTISGLQRWTAHRFAVDVAWMSPLVLAADGRHEAAIELFEKFGGKGGADDGDGQMLLNTSAQVKKHVFEEALECYLALRDVQSAVRWCDEKAHVFLVDQSENGVKDVLLEKRLSYLKQLGEFTRTDDNREEKKQKGLLPWSLTDFCRSNESRLVQLSAQMGNEKVSSIVDTLETMADDIDFQQKMLTCGSWPSALNVELELLHSLNGCLSDAAENGSPPMFECNLRGFSCLAELKARPALRQRALSFVADWNGRLDAAFSRDFHLAASRLARKNGNRGLAHRMLVAHVGCDSSADMLTTLRTTYPQPRADALAVARHAAKLLDATERSDDAFALLTDSVARSLDVAGASTTAGGGGGGGGESLLEVVRRRLVDASCAPDADSPWQRQLSKAMLQLGAWMQADARRGNLLLENEESVFIKLIEERLNETEQTLGSLDKGSVVGTLFDLSTKLCRNHVKAQNTFADWAYEAGKRTVNGSSREEHVLLTSAEVDMIKAAVPQSASASELEAVIGLVSSLRSGDANTAADMIVRQLQAACPGIQYSETLVDIWERANDRLFGFYDKSAVAYFAFLRFDAGQSAVAVTATLRLLRLLVLHISYLDPKIQDEFESTEPTAWHCVIPQLFARLNHPSPTVRDILCRLLERMAVASPHVVCYPAVIGAIGGGGGGRGAALFDDDDDDDDETLARADQTLMEACCARLVERLRLADERLVTDANTFVRELRRVTLLREEKWFSVLGYLQHEIAKRIRQLADETSKTNNLAHLTASERQDLLKEKAVVFTRFVFQALEDLYTATCEEPADTPNESGFVQEFQGLISKALTHAAENSLKPEVAWQPFEQLLAILSQRAAKRSNLLLDMNCISPVLAALRDTLVPLPGQHSRADAAAVVHIVAIQPTVTILPTKTRPKKLSLLGDDGCKYAYLFKGMEDLHLDERVMQLLRICNLMLSEKQRGGAPFHARHYSVTPLGPRSGLIQWVDGAVPIFSIYRRFQMREAAAAARAPSAIPRPSEMFYGKLAPALEQRGIRDLANRAKWPTSVLKSVLAELVAETPSDLLAKELWCRSANADVWFELTQRYARSSAVMSVVGYVIGLGDRHLDNLLIDLKSGDVVHIDYNVCFDKGKQLRVPETVPFRMTHSLQAALGPTGVEGVYRMSCERVLGVMRQSRETLLTLLEAFVYDPLVDWAASHELAAIGPALVLTIYGAQRRSDDAFARATRDLARRLFAVRRRELTVPWRVNRQELAAALTALVDALGRLSSLQEAASAATESQRAAEEAIALLPATGADASHTHGAFGLQYQQYCTFLSNLQLTAQERSEKMIRISAEVQRCCADARAALSAHHQMMLDIRVVLKALAKGEDRLGKAAESTGCKFSAYITYYKENFGEPLAACLRLIADKSELAAADVSTAVRGCNTVLASLAQIYDGLLALDGDGRIDETSEWPRLGEPSDPPPQPVMAIGSPKEKPAAAGQTEERNVHALNIWRRVRAKLEGRDTPDGRRVSVAQQVDAMVSDAVSADNLALMYEGWTAWV